MNYGLKNTKSERQCNIFCYLFLFRHSIRGDTSRAKLLTSVPYGANNLTSKPVNLNEEGT